AAIEVARVFYEAIADGLPVDLALTDARKAVCLAMPGSLEWGVPVLYTHTDNGVLFELTGTKPQPQSGPEPQPPDVPPPPPRPERPVPARGNRPPKRTGAHSPRRVP